jgi:hypothetical protein
MRPFLVIAFPEQRAQQLRGQVTTSLTGLFFHFLGENTSGGTKSMDRFVTWQEKGKEENAYFPCPSVISSLKMYPGR